MAPAFQGFGRIFLVSAGHAAVQPQEDPKFTPFISSVALPFIVVRPSTGIRGVQDYTDGLVQL